MFAVEMTMMIICGEGGKMAGMRVILRPPCFIQRFLSFRQSETTEKSILFATLRFTIQPLKVPEKQ